MAPSDSHVPGADQQIPGPSKGKQTCSQCRARKVKCDGRLDFCSNCERLGYECSFRAAGLLSGPSLLGTNSSASALPSRTSKGRRVARACTECHLAKSRCNGALPTCQRCAARGLHCIYEPRSGSRRRHPDSVSPRPGLSQSFIETHSSGDAVISRPVGIQTSPSYEMFDVPQTVSTDAGYQQQFPMLNRERVVPAIRKFFEHLHCLPSLAFLHRPSLMRLYHTQEADPALIASIVAVSSRLPGTVPEEANIGFRCADIAEGLVNNTVKQPSIFRLQALLLLLRFRLWTSSPNDPLVLMPYLARSAFLLRLNYETFRPSSFVQESRRRVMWATYMLDVTLADGLPEYSTCSINTIHLRLPCMEDDFELDTDTVSERVNPKASAGTGWRVGIIGFYIRIIHLNDQILRYIKKLLNLRTEPNSVEFLRFEEDLSDFQSRLPGHERYSHKTLALRAFSPRLARFVMTHVWWHVCHCQLFRPLLPTIPETYSQRLVVALGDVLVVEYQQKSLEHALHAVSILSALRNLDSDICVLDLDMAECAFKISETLMLSSDSARANLGLGRAEILQNAYVCLRLTESMVNMYPAIKPIVADLTSALQSFAKGEPCFVASSPPQTSPKQAITKHSALYRATFVDDSFKLEIPSASGTQTPDVTMTGRLPGLHPTPSALLDSQNLGSYAGLSEVNSGPGEPHNAFLWPGEVPDDIWDQISLFRGPFDSGELESQDPSVDQQS